jgi:hypothetical protein
MKEKIIFAILISFFIIPSALASITYQNCRVNSCPVTITDCAGGLVDIYSSSTCTGNPSYEYSFSSGSFPWYPGSAGAYYMLALCDDERTHSICSPVTVSSLITTSSSTTTTTEISTPITPSGNSNIILYVLVIVIIVVVAFIAYRLFTKKKKPRIDYESLYRKWGK